MEAGGSLTTGPFGEEQSRASVGGGSSGSVACGSTRGGANPERCQLEPGEGYVKAFQHRQQLSQLVHMRQKRASSVQVSGQGHRGASRTAEPLQTAHISLTRDRASLQERERLLEEEISYLDYRLEEMRSGHEAQIFAEELQPKLSSGAMRGGTCSERHRSTEGTPARTGSARAGTAAWADDQQRRRWSPAAQARKRFACSSTPPCPAWLPESRLAAQPCRVHSTAAEQVRAGLQGAVERSFVGGRHPHRPAPPYISIAAA